MHWTSYVLIPLGGLVAGYINTLAGSGSLLTLPLLIYAGGLAPTIANGTNRVAVLAASAVATRGFALQKRIDWGHSPWLVLPAVAGAILGAQIAVDIDERAMKLAIVMLMGVMLVVILVRPTRWLQGAGESAQRGHWWQVPVFFAVGVYGGFIQAGVGIFLLASLVLAGGYDLVRANGMKVLIVLCFTVFALGVFAFHNQVHWPLGLLLAAGNMAGAQLATKTAARRGAGFVRWVLVIIVILAAGKMLYDVLFAINSAP